MCPSSVDVCLICAENHSYKNCPRNSKKCSNCDSSEHVATCRNCPHIISYLNKSKKVNTNNTATSTNNTANSKNNTTTNYSNLNNNSSNSINIQHSKLDRLEKLILKQAENTTKYESLFKQQFESMEKMQALLVNQEVTINALIGRTDRIERNFIDQNPPIHSQVSHNSTSNQSTNQSYSDSLYQNNCYGHQINHILSNHKNDPILKNFNQYSSNQNNNNRT